MCSYKCFMAFYPDSEGSYFAEFKCMCVLDEQPAAPSDRTAHLKLQLNRIMVIGQALVLSSYPGTLQ